MIKRETVRIGADEFVHTFSDGFFLIERNGTQLVDAYDPIDRADVCVYSETDVSIDPTSDELEMALRVAGSLLSKMAVPARRHATIGDLDESQKEPSPHDE